MDNAIAFEVFRYYYLLQLLANERLNDLYNYRNGMDIGPVLPQMYIPPHPVVTDDILLQQLINQHPAWKILESAECGENAADRIIGGTNAALGEFPWIARLGYESEDFDDEFDFKCGGALISSRFVMTAAHCVNDDDVKTIRLGEHNVNTDPDCELKVCAPKVQDRRVKRIIKHPQYGKPFLHNDIAIIEMDTPVKLNDYVVPICIPKTKEQLADIPKGEKLKVSGWGTTNMTTEDRADILQVVSLPVLEPAICNILGTGSGFKITKAELCVGSERNKDSCTGDSGGPLTKVFDTPEGPKTYLVGVVSFGPKICGSKMPGIYTLVSYFLKWVLDTIVS